MGHGTEWNLRNVTTEVVVPFNAPESWLYTPDKKMFYK
jgi:hypothetical protein